MKINEQLVNLRKKMKEKNIDAILVSTGDPHQSEYLSDHYKTREFISGFTGSNGTAVITKDKALIWTDGRYFIQCEKEISGSEFEMRKFSTPGEISISEFLLQNLHPENRVEVDFEYYSRKEFSDLFTKLSKKKIHLVHGKTIEELWENQPPISKEKVFLLEEKYSGESRKSKMKRVQEEYKKRGADSLFISSLEDIAWILNIRGRDIPNNPVTISYFYLMDQGGVLFIHSSKVSDSIRDQLEEDGIHLLDYDRVFEELKSIKNKRIYFDPLRNSQGIYNVLKENNEIIYGKEITSEFKSIKNNVEVDNLKKAYLEDGIALTKFIYRIKNTVDKESLGEYDVASYLKELRKERKHFIEESFDTISAVGENAAMMHYSANKDNQDFLKSSGFLLVDSGGQYLYGTTDTTRTIALGEISENEKHDFTLVLKSSIAVLQMVFLKGTRDSDLDIIARYPLWQEGKDYKCGTGHGVGYLLSVHEGPPRLAFKFSSPSELKLGQMFTVEPGIYRENEYGIRIENTVIVSKAMNTFDGEFYSLYNLTRVPIDLDAININLLNNEEIKYLNTYHEIVYKDLSPHLSKDEKDWLRKVTSPICK